MKNQVLSIVQMRHLEDLGIDTSKASMCWLHLNLLDEEWIVCANDSYSKDAEVELVPTFTLQDIIDLLPDYISYKGKVARLFIEKDGAGYYDESPISFTNAVVSNRWTCSEFDNLGQGSEDYRVPITFLDAMYRLLLFLAENGYLNNNKTE